MMNEYDRLVFENNAMKQIISELQGKLTRTETMLSNTETKLEESKRAYERLEADFENFAYERSKQYVVRKAT
jgi:molecular chaperone GrpE (heat shock protein)